MKIIKSLLFMVVLSLYMFNVKSGSTNYVSLLLLGILLFIFIIINKNSSFISSKVFKWYLMFFLLSLVSFTFSIKPINSIYKVPNFILNLIIIFILSNYINSKERLEEIIKIIIYSGFINSIFLLFLSDYSAVDTFNRVGNNMGNVNLIAIQIAYSLIFSFIIIKNKERKKKYYIMIIFMIIAILFTGARQVFIMLCVFITLELFLKDYNKLLKNIKNICISIIVISILFTIIMKNDFLYMILGARIEEMIQLFLGNNVIEKSLNSRSNMIIMGIKWFRLRPIQGYGIDTFKVIYENLFGINYYAHNNYIELLVDLGLIGTILYYNFYFKSLIKLFRLKLYKNYTTCIFFVLLISQLVLEFAWVSYGSRILIIILTIIDRYIYLKDRGELELWN